ncbi:MULTISPECIES: methyltransferase domain-containing protein [Actinomadura]|uniref:Methyltransferase domain-containing protein n=1 Tax=Actinomadura yumaensis TaxID=111807 RepID=A0ABW2CD95_9ACTN|nr:methyltransferase domain-containing protein [Actinomadura sp. J1-007]MWK33678.1 methyltransferase domain-containing protein [Actinomadura sp. J1-007]
MPARPPEPTIASLRDAPGDGAGDGDSMALYWTFYWAVAEAQIARWLPRRPSRVLDVSGGGGHSAAQAAAAGHSVIEVLDPLENERERLAPERRSNGAGPGASARPAARPAEADGRAVTGSGNGTAGQGAARSGRAAVWEAGAQGAQGNGNGRQPVPARRGHGGPGRDEGPVRVIGEAGSLAFLGDGTVDAVVAENRVLSRHLVTESTVAEIARVLRPGGRVLLSVDSLTLGMALLAEQNCWAHLSDVPSAEVVLVPWPDGTITRCFWADQLRELLTEVGLEVEWIKPRTVLSPSTVEHVLKASPHAMARLVRTELSAPPGDESLGIHLVASARRRT